MLPIYTYYSTPWRMETGDDIRVHSICATLAGFGEEVFVFNLSHRVQRYTVRKEGGVTYINMPRRFYSLVATAIGHKHGEDLEPLIKLTHYVDEFIAGVKLLVWIQAYCDPPRVVVFGSMSLLSFLMRVCGFRGRILFDPMANYSQTLHLRSRKSLRQLMRYGLYLALHKMQLAACDSISYPSEFDASNSARMFRLSAKSVFVIPNVAPLSYAEGEYEILRGGRTDHSMPYFVLLAGGRGPTNLDLLRMTLRVFNAQPPGTYLLMITGPWRDFRRHVSNPSVRLLGIVSQQDLKRILAIADFGLVPVFNHAAGTFLKTLTYVVGGLDLVASRSGIQGIPPSLLHSTRAYIVQNEDEYAKTIRGIVDEWPGNRDRTRRIPAVREKSDLDATLRKFIST